MLGLSESFFQGSPFNSSSDSSFGIEWRKKNNLNQMNTNRTYSPGVAYLKSPNISPIVKKLEQMTITEEPDEGIEKTYIIEEATLNKSTSNSPHTPMNKTYVIEHVKKYQKNVGVEKNMENERKKIYKRRTMFLLPPTPTSIKAVSKLNTSDFEHRFTVNTILKEIGMTKYIKLFEMEEVGVFTNIFHQKKIKNMISDKHFRIFDTQRRRFDFHWNLGPGGASGNYQSCRNLSISKVKRDF